MEKKARAVTESSVYLTVIAAILVVVNVLAYSIHKQFDTTKNERFTLSKGSGRLVANLKKPVTVRAYVTTGLAKLDSFGRDLDDLMREYERASGGKFIYQKVIAKNEAEKNEAKEAQCREAAFGEGSETGEDSTQITQGYMCLVFLYGDEKDNIPFLSPDTVGGLEFWISNKVREVRDKAEDNHRRIGVITGHDEIKLSEQNLLPNEGRPPPSIKSVIENAFPYYKFEDVDLKGGETVIDEQIDALIVTQPGKDFTDKELRRIDEFLMKENKALVVYASAVNIKPSDPKMTATLATHNLEKLLMGYGVEIKKDAVLDWARSVRVPVPTQAGGMTVVRAPAIVQAQPSGDLDAEHQMLDNSFIGFFRIEELSFPFPSSLVVDPKKQAGAEVKVVARSTPAAWVEAGDNVDLGIRADWRAKPPLDQRAIAVSVTGKLKSAMGAGDGVEVPAESKGQSRVLVVSSAQFLANPFARAGNGTQMEGMGHMGMQMPPVGGDPSLRMISQPYAQKYLTNTIIAFKNTLDWATGDSDMVAASAKMLGDPNLTYSDLSRPKLEATDDEASIKAKDEQYRMQRKTVQRNVQLTLILFAPLAFAGIGILRWQMRERRRNEFKALPEAPRPPNDPRPPWP
jgi:gliding motility-associatede transport system auxiliary component